MFIAHLNDYHKWTRSQIADWVELVEPPMPTPDDAASTVDVSETRDARRQRRRTNQLSSKC